MSRLLSFSFLRNFARLFSGFGVLFLFLFSSAAVAQTTATYDFTMVHEPYTMLAEGLSFGILPGDQAAALDMEGEMLPLYGHPFYPNADTPIVVFGTGLLRLDNPGYSVAIDAFLAELIPLDERSDILFESAPVNGESVLKIEWRYAGILDTPDVADDYVNFQIWIYQTSGIVEMRYGPSNLADDYGEAIGGGPYAGIFRSSPWTIFRVLQKDWLTGDAANPQFEYIGEDLPPLSGAPPEGTVYRFTPKVSSGIEATATIQGGYRLYPNPTSGSVRIEAPETFGENVRVRVMDLLGRIVDERRADGSASGLEIDLPAPGIYYCEIIGADGATVVRSVVRR